MKKLMILAILLFLLIGNFSVVLAAPWSNPNGYWVYDITCENGKTFDIWVAQNYSVTMFTSSGEVGVMRALYVDFGEGLEPLWQSPGNGVFKNTTWCTWVFEGMNMGGEVLIR